MHMSPSDPADGQDQFEQSAAGEVGGNVPDSPEVAAALPGVVGLGDAADEFASVIDIGDRYLGLSTAGVGAKVAIARVVDSFAPLGMDAVAATVNDLLAEGLTPVCYVNHLSMAEEDDDRAVEIGRGIAEAAEQAGILLLGGDRSRTSADVARFDVVGTAAGVGDETERFPGDAATGDRLVGFPASGLHPRVASEAGTALETAVDLGDEFPGDIYETVGSALLQPTRQYSYVREALRESTVHAAVHLAAGGWTRLRTMGDFQFSITDPFDPGAVESLIQERTEYSLESLYRRFPMGTGFVVAVPESAATELAARTDGEIVGVVERGTGVNIRGLDLELDVD